MAEGKGKYLIIGLIGFIVGALLVAAFDEHCIDIALCDIMMPGIDGVSLVESIRKLNPECGFVLMDKLEQMDLDTLREFGAWLESEGLQAIATRVSTGDECSIIIEDGTVKDTPAEPVKPTWQKGAF